jgi:hypothetical protein
VQPGPAKHSADEMMRLSINREINFIYVNGFINNQSAYLARCFHAIFSIHTAVIIIDYTSQQQFVSSINKTDSNNLGEECENKLYE